MVDQPLLAGRLSTKRRERSANFVNRSALLASTTSVNGLPVFSRSRNSCHSTPSAKHSFTPIPSSEPSSISNGSTSPNSADPASLSALMEIQHNNLFRIARLPAPNFFAASTPGRFLVLAVRCWHGFSNLHGLLRRRSKCWGSCSGTGRRKDSRSGLPRTGETQVRDSNVGCASRECRLLHRRAGKTSRGRNKDCSRDRAASDHGRVPTGG